MAHWINATLHLWNGVDLHLLQNSVDITYEPDKPDDIGFQGIVIQPTTSQEAHDLALAFRKAARRFEEIGKSLP